MVKTCLIHSRCNISLIHPLVLWHLDWRGSVRSTPKCSTQRKPCMWVWIKIITNSAEEHCSLKHWCIHLCLLAGALWGKELVWRGVLWGLLHSIFSPWNPYPVWQVSHTYMHVAHLQGYTCTPSQPHPQATSYNWYEPDFNSCLALFCISLHIVTH